MIEIDEMNSRSLCGLHAPVCDLVQPDRAGDERHHPHVALLWLHEYHCLHVLPTHRNHWIYVLFLVQLPDLWIHQSGLKWSWGLLMGRLDWERVLTVDDTFIVFISSSF